MKIIICDDEKKLRKDLRGLIEVQLDLCGMEYTIEEFENGRKLLEAEGTGEMDILFLDIEMPELSGMETAKALRQAGCRALIIFVTAYPDFVFQGYEVQAFHYILKPYQEKKIKEVLEKALQASGQKKQRYFIIEHKGGSLRLPVTDILYFKSEGRSAIAVTKERQEVFYGRLDEVEAQISQISKGFQRVHNRYLVNLQHVSEVTAKGCVCGGAEIPVSRAHKQQLAVAFAQMMLG